MRPFAVTRSSLPTRLGIAPNCAVSNASRPEIAVPQTRQQCGTLVGGLAGRGRLRLVSAAAPATPAAPAAAGAPPDGPFGRRLGTSFGGRRPFGAPGRARRRQRRQLGGWLDRFPLALQAVHLAQGRPDLP